LLLFVLLAANLVVQHRGSMTNVELNVENADVWNDDTDARVTPVIG
jgi:hypothetical protein